MKFLWQIKAGKSLKSKFMWLLCDGNLGHKAVETIIFFRLCKFAKQNFLGPVFSANWVRFFRCMKEKTVQDFDLVGKMIDKIKALGKSHEKTLQLVTLLIYRIDCLYLAWRKHKLLMAIKDLMITTDINNEDWNFLVTWTTPESFIHQSIIAKYKINGEWNLILNYSERFDDSS